MPFFAFQAMVQQMTQDKEQANLQYQNYVQHLNAEVSSLSDKNAELQEENTRLQARDKQLIDHIGTLEKEIQRNIARQDQQMELEKTQVSRAHKKNIHINTITPTHLSPYHSKALPTPIANCRRSIRNSKRPYKNSIWNVMNFN